MSLKMSKKCDQTMISIVRQKAEENLRILKKMFGKYEYHSQKCSKSKDLVNSKSNIQTVESIVVSNKPLTYFYCSMASVFVSFNLFQKIF